MAKLTHMKQSAAETKKSDGPVSVSKSKGPLYPWGLNVASGFSTLSLMKSGGNVVISGTAAGATASGGKTRHSAQVQITHLGLGGRTAKLKTAPSGKANAKYSKVRTLKSPKAKE